MELVLLITADLVDTYIEHVRSHRRLAESTLTNYRDELMLLVAASPAITPNALGHWVSTGTGGEPLAPATRNRRLVILRGFTKYLVAKGTLAADPTEGIEKSRVPRRRRTALTVPDLRKLLTATSKAQQSWVCARDRAIIYVLFYTGLRVSELVALDVDQVDLGASVFRAARRKGGHETDEYVPEPALREVAAYLAERPASSDTALLLAKHHRRPTKRAIQKRLQHLGELAGLRARIHPHALRHALCRGILIEAQEPFPSHAR